MKVEVLNRIIPLYGNKHVSPYGEIIITTPNGMTYKRKFDEGKENIYLIQHKKYKLQSNGSLYNREYFLKEIKTMKNNNTKNNNTKIYEVAFEHCDEDDTSTFVTWLYSTKEKALSKFKKEKDSLMETFCIDIADCLTEEEAGQGEEGYVLENGEDVFAYYENCYYNRFHVCLEITEKIIDEATEC